jgi:hypothetical protein
LRQLRDIDRAHSTLTLIQEGAVSLFIVGWSEDGQTRQHCITKRIIPMTRAAKGRNTGLTGVSLASLGAARKGARPRRHARGKRACLAMA